MRYIYDNTYEGLLSAIYEVFAFCDRNAEIVAARDLPGPSLYETRETPTDEAHAASVSSWLERLGGNVSGGFYIAWLSREPGIDDLILAVMRIAKKHKCDPFALRQYQQVCDLDGARRRVGSEAHRMLQFVRFVKLEERVYAADIRTDYDVLQLIGEHFHRRFRDVAFMIRDIERGRAILSNPREWYIAELPEYNPPIRGDDKYETLWREYFKTIAIEQRVNLRLQQHFVPKKYRSTMTEFMSDEPAG